MKRTIRQFAIGGMLSCLLCAAYGQTCEPYIRLGIGTGVNPDFIEGIGMDLEGGVSYKGIEASVSLTLLNSLPLEGTSQYLAYQTQRHESTVFDGVNDNLSGQRDISVMVNVGYDLLRLIPDNRRHHLTPFVGIGWSGLTSLRAIYRDIPASVPGPEDVTRGSCIAYAHDSAFDYCLGARYEYSFSDRWGAGVVYKYLDLQEGGLLGIYASYHF